MSRLANEAVITFLQILGKCVSYSCSNYMLMRTCSSVCLSASTSSFGKNYVFCRIHTMSRYTHLSRL
jgi:hypothetical protein